MDGQIRLVKVTVRDGDEDGGQDARSDKGTDQRLNKDGVLDLTQSWLLDPNLTVKDLADDIALLVLGDPRLILVAVAVVADQRLL